MATMDRELKSLILDGPNSPEAEADEIYPPVDEEECIQKLVKLTGKSRQELLKMIQESLDKEDSYEY